MSKLTEITLRSLGLSFDENQANEKGEIQVSAPYRTDRNPSLSINLNDGVWYDHGIGEGGDIYKLVMKTNGISFSEAKEFVDGKGTAKKFQTRKPKYYEDLNNGPFWTEGRKQTLVAAQERLNNATDSKVLQDLRNYDGITKETLQHSDCGLIDWNFGDGEKEALLSPYPTGAQVYARDENRKQIRMFTGSKPAESFSGAGQIQGKKDLLITKSPRERKLAFQELRDSFDVIGINSGETDKLSDEQTAFLKAKAHYYKRVFVCFDRDTVPAEEIAFGFARKVCDAIANYNRDIRLINIEALGGSNCKDLTDLVKAKGIAWVDTLLDDQLEQYSNFVWNTNTQQNRFWMFSDRGKLVIDEVKLAAVLQRNGFKKSYLNGEKKPTLIRDKGNILFDVSTDEIGDFLMEDLFGGLSRIIDFIETENGTEAITKTQLKYALFGYRERILNSKISFIFKSEDPAVMQDTRQESFLYFENGVADISKKNVQVIPFTELPRKVWKSQILDRAFNPDCPSGQSEFERFIELIAAKDSARKKSFMSTLGYLAHTYKDRSRSPAIILIDEESRPGFSNGRTGKGLFAQSLKHIRQLNFTPGKTLDTTSRFFFQTVKNADQILYFDDVKDGFDFESLFNVITDDMEIEIKHQSPIKIPFEQSPKIVLSTNSLIAGVGSSFAHRKFTLELCSYFSPSHTPKDEFGHNFFEDWDADEWSRFDHFIIRCIQLFFQEGLIDFPDSTVEVKALIADTSPDFYDWAKSHLEPGVTYKANVMFNGKNKMLDTQNPPREEPTNSDGNSFPCFADVSNELLDGQFRTFVDWLQRFADFKNWRYNEQKSMGYKKVTFTEK